MKIDFRTFFVLLFLGFMWGSSFMLMKKGLIEFSPIQVASLRLVFAGSVAVFFFFREYKKLKPKDWMFLTLSGLLGNFFPAFLFANAGSLMPSSLSGALNAMTPFFTLIMGVVLFSNAFKLKQGVGIGVGLIGSLILIFTKSTSGFSFQSDYIWPCLQVVLAAFLYGINVNIIKNKLSHLSAIVNSMVPLTIISVPALFIALANNTWHTATHASNHSSLLFIIVLGVFGSAVSLIVFNTLVKKTTALFAASVTYLIPIFAYGWGVLDGEPIGLFQILGMVFILLGITLTRK